MRRPLLILACVTVAALPVAFVAGSQLVPRTETVTKPVLVKPRAGWKPERVAAVFDNLTAYGVQAQDGIACSTYASSAEPPVWAVNLCVQVGSGPAG